ncbi:hypothetical protein [Parafrankia sp. BMG5.11]|nr:hypothetical protein [Parafrankia sp. BMG5.11]
MLLLGLTTSKESRLTIAEMIDSAIEREGGYSKQPSYHGGETI